MDNTEPPRNIQAVMEASNYVRHGCFTMFGYSRLTCICPKVPCGGVAFDTEDYDCPEHEINPAQYLHWASECPGPRAQA
ncbi:hypothetical protein [Streptomyces rubiginosohelvolus]|uniref:hypothetical protein n=1 Tax=Streptomyces rubiginosohelvolus TaxID=67362 RepID=UPI0036686A17